MSRQQTSDSRDLKNLRHFMARSDGRRSYAPAIYKAPGNAMCDCVIDPLTGRSYCICSAMITTDMAFAPDQVARVVNPQVRFASPCERASLKRRQMYFAKSTA
jgi:hypothetical protein